MKRDRIKIGFAPTKRDIFNHPETFELRETILQQISGWLQDVVEIVDIDDVTQQGLLETEDGAIAVTEKFRREGVDGLFVPHCNFGSESSIVYVASRLNVPVLVWGPQDNDPSTPIDFKISSVGRARDTQCGLFATGKALRRVNVPFTYLPNAPLESDVLERGYKAFVSVCATVKAFKETKILQIGTRPEAFWTVICNEGELLERFGIRVFPITLVELQQASQELKETAPDEIAETVSLISKLTTPVGVNDDDLVNMAAYYLALQALCSKYHCNAVATSCWDAFQAAMGISACAVNGYVGQTGIPVVCEMDIHGAISSRLMQAAGLYTDPVFFADLTIRHPTNPNAELLWHCGNFPPCMAKDPAACTVRNIPAATPSPGKSYFELRTDEDMTICRFDGDHGEYSLLMGQGKSVEGPATTGTYSWFEVNDWVAWEEKLVYGPYVHHTAGTYGKLSPILHETCKYIGVTPDPTDPDTAGIQNFWRGR
ncbi:L-fucose/L-arabinose isomerase family protein [Oscillospiraceae bacterium MB08-C2-2]|nr:L-fucose/L-arabinose isomerase family protein [Oscillospiraceae bacterium MB08-C2-2]